MTHAHESRPAAEFVRTNLHGPGGGAAPGLGCGKSVDVAVWNVVLPPTFFRLWRMWPFSTVTDPKRFR
jgi:hypothetical protein